MKVRQPAWQQALSIAFYIDVCLLGLVALLGLALVTLSPRLSVGGAHWQAGALVMSVPLPGNGGDYLYGPPVLEIGGAAWPATADSVARARLARLGGSTPRPPP